MQAACMSPLVLMVAGCCSWAETLGGWFFSLMLRFCLELSLPIWADGRAHCSQWPPHTPCRAVYVCLCASHAWLCAFLFPRNIHILDTLHYIAWATSQDYIESIIWDFCACQHNSYLHCLAMGICTHTCTQTHTQAHTLNKNWQPDVHLLI